MRRLSLFPAITSMLLAAVPTNAAAVDPNVLKAAITLNLVRYIEFPKDRADSTIKLCVVRNLPVAAELTRLNGQRVDYRVIAYRTIDEGAASGCDVVMVGAAARAEVGRYRQYGRVVIGDGPSFLNAGGTISLVRTGNQIRFEISVKAAREAGVTISSKILRLAARVQQ